MREKTSKLLMAWIAAWAILLVGTLCSLGVERTTAALDVSAQAVPVSAQSGTAGVRDASVCAVESETDHGDWPAAWPDSGCAVPVPSGCTPFERTLPGRDVDLPVPGLRLGHAHPISLVHPPVRGPPV